MRSSYANFPFSRATFWKMENHFWKSDSTVCLFIFNFSFSFFFFFSFRGQWKIPGGRACVPAAVKMNGASASLRVKHGRHRSASCPLFSIFLQLSDLKNKLKWKTKPNFHLHSPTLQWTSFQKFFIQIISIFRFNFNSFKKNVTNSDWTFDKNFQISACFRFHWF